MTVEWEKWK